MALAALLQADPRAAGVATQLRSQQRVLAPRGVVIPPEYIDDFAAQLVKWAGVDDIARIRATPADILTSFSEQGETYAPGVVFHREGENPQFSTLGAEVFGDANVGTVFAVSGDGRYVYTVHWLDDPGVALFWAFPNVRESWFAPLVPLIAVAATFIGLPTLIGNAVLGAEAAAAYPMAAKTVGSIAVQTALTGGDVERAARAAAASLIGGELGDVAGTGLDSALVGKATAAATTAALSGGDVRTAVSRALVYAGAQAMDDYDWTGIGEDYIDPWLSGDTGDWLTWGELGVDLDPASLDNALILNEDTLDFLGIPVDTLAPDDAGNLTSVTGDLVEATDVTYAESMYLDEGGNVRDIYGNIIIEAADLPTLSEAEIARAMQTYMAENDGAVLQPPQQQPQLRPAALPPPATQVKMPSITDFTKTVEALGKAAATLAAAARAFKTGTYTPPYTTSPNGTPRNTPPGVPIQRPDGSVVTNNGNGTQTVRYPDGRVVTMPSTVSGSTPVATSLLPGVSNQALLIGGAVLVGAVLLARR